MTTLFCQEAPHVLVGPGTEKDGNAIQFIRGYAEIADDDPRYEEKLGWIKVTSVPRIEILDEREPPRAVALETADGYAGQFVCDQHDPVKAFKTQGGLNLHRVNAHSPKAMREAAVT